MMPGLCPSGRPAALVVPRFRDSRAVSNQFADLSSCPLTRKGPAHEDPCQRITPQ